MIRIPVKDKVDEVVLYGPADAQEYLRVSAATLCRYRREGWLTGHPIARGYYYTRQQLDACMVALGQDRINVNVEKEVDVHG
jgi:hypothetical protein